MLLHLALQAEVAEHLGPQTTEECIEAWRHLKPYAESLEKDSKALGRLQGRTVVCFFINNHHRRLFRAPFSAKGPY